MSDPDETGPRVSVLILSWNTRELSVACLRALAAETARHAREVLVLDNASADASAAAITSEFPGVELVLSDTNLGYAAGNNRLARAARGAYLCLLNSDTEVEPGAIDTLVDWLEAHEDYAAAAPMLVSSDGRVQRACKRLPTLALPAVYDLFYRRLWGLRRVEARYFYEDFDHRESRDVEQPPGSCFVVRHALFAELGGLDERLWLFFNDVDLCKRILARGMKIRYVASARVVHHEGSSTRRYGPMVEEWNTNRIAYYRKHHGAIGAFVVRCFVRLRALQEWFALGRRHARDKAAMRAARADLARVLRRILAGDGDRRDGDRRDGDRRDGDRRDGAGGESRRGPARAER